MTAVFPTPRQRGMHELTALTADLSALNPPETWLLGYERGFDAAMALCLQIENAINDAQTPEFSERDNLPASDGNAR